MLTVGFQTDFSDRRMVKNSLKPSRVDQERSELTAEIFDFAEMEREDFEKLE